MSLVDSVVISSCFWGGTSDSSLNGVDGVDVDLAAAFGSSRIAQAAMARASKNVLITLSKATALIEMDPAAVDDARLTAIGDLVPCR